MHGISEDVPHLILHAARMPFRPLLELVRDVILEVSNDELRHLSASGMMISRYHREP